MRDEITRLADIIGKNGAEPTESDRITFEAWMRGHCWAVEGEWTGKTYKHAREESGDYVHAGAMNTRRLFAAWRDRRALDEAIAALTDHVEDKLGMVADGWRNRIVAVERNSEYDADLRTDTPILILRFASVSLRESANPLAKGWVDRGLVAAALAQPADADSEGAK